MVSSQKIHRQFAAWDRNPPAIGPMTGAINMLRLKILMMNPRSVTGTRSAMDPPPLVKGAPPNTPAMSRKIKSAVELGERPHMAVNSVKRMFPTW